MKAESKIADNNGVRIHYLDSNSDSSMVPVLICPGLSETAEEYTDLMAYMMPRRCVALSFRGRGGSDTPEAGYDLAQHIVDIECVVQAAGLNRFHLYAYSRGVSYALGYAENNLSRISSLIVQDYPAMHKRMPDGWANQYISSYLVPFSRQRNIRPEAIRGIQLESEHLQFNYALPKKLLVLRGMLEDSLLDDEGVDGYRKLNADVIVKNFERSGHDIRSTERDHLYKTIGDFINSL
ncbi:alpha/beta fold hydrolase [Cohnella yongneupensis]|uniref:Alpha/beta fold hydrolase n=1 Tax=Cohnella yongneupensis TaxID=425006 RepID=A0ABW0QTX6_9BACL